MLVTKAHLCVRHAASKDETRPNLNGVRFRSVENPDAKPGDAVYATTEATDGHMLIRVTAASSPDSEYPALPGYESSDAAPEPFTLPLGAADELKDVLQWAGKRRGSMPILTNVLLDVPHANANGSVRFVATDLETQRKVEAKKIEGEYPNTDRVIPEKPTLPDGEAAPASFTVDLNLLERVLKAAREGGFAGRTSVAARFYVTDPLSALRIEISHPNVGELLAVIMPLKP